MSIKFRHVIIPVVLGLVLIGIGVGLSTTLPDSVANSQTGFSLDMNGTWKTVGKPVVTAEVVDRMIEITIETDDGSVAYYYGTFPNPLASGAGINSDAKEKSNKFFISTEKTKAFVYQDGKIKFDFSAFGATKMMELSRV